MLTFDILMDTAKCAEMIRQIRWEQGLICPRCKNRNIREIATRPDGIRRYHCNSCKKRFTDISDTIFEKSHIPISRWFLASYLMKFNVTDRQLAAELGVEENTARRLAELIRASAFFRDADDQVTVSGGGR